MNELIYTMLKIIALTTAPILLFILRVAFYKMTPEDIKQKALREEWIG